MSVNSNPAASQLNMKKLSISKIFSFLAGVVVTLREFSYNFEIARIGYSRARKKPWHEINLKTKISCQAPFKTAESAPIGQLLEKCQLPSWIPRSWAGFAESHLALMQIKTRIVDD
jgi:hypothetical protein